ncbi:MAG: hypothetical protein JWO31_1373 [Phycisphaerales bacterium]|nr:hypothetical protein [Phycisphaerales bacterium]
MRDLRSSPLHSAALRAIQALHKFCVEHEGHYATQLADCERALESGSGERYRESIKAVPFGGMGTFMDWLPPTVYPHETDEYVWTVFEALSERWVRLTKHLLP